MSGFKGIERRGFGRRESSIHGLALVPGRGAVPCIVRNFSAGGALVTFNEPLVAPYQFRLVIADRRVDVPCEVRHYGRFGTGVSFLETVDVSAFFLPVPQGRRQPLVRPREVEAVRPLGVRELRRQVRDQIAARRGGILDRLLAGPRPTARLHGVADRLPS